MADRQEYVVYTGCRILDPVAGFFNIPIDQVSGGQSRVFPVVWVVFRGGGEVVGLFKRTLPKKDVSDNR